MTIDLHVFTHLFTAGSFFEFLIIFLGFGATVLSRYRTQLSLIILMIRFTILLAKILPNNVEPRIKKTLHDALKELRFEKNKLFHDDQIPGVG